MPLCLRPRAGFVVVAGVFLAQLATPALAQDLLINGGAEEGDLSGWTLDGSAFPAGRSVFGVDTAALSDNSLPPLTGSFVFEMDAVSTGAAANSGVIARMTQTVGPLADRPALRLTVAFASSPLPSCDPARFTLSFLNARGDVIDTPIDSGFRLSSSWFNAADIVVIPPAAVAARVTLEGRLDCGTFINTYFDRVSLTYPDCGPADLAPRFGELTFADITAFLAAFSNQDAAADLAEPVGQFTFADISAFLAAFSAGCP